jgi:hypothetical protein
LDKRTPSTTKLERCLAIKFTEVNPNNDRRLHISYYSNSIFTFILR